MCDPDDNPIRDVRRLAAVRASNLHGHPARGFVRPPGSAGGPVDASAPSAAVSLLDADRQFIKGGVGLDRGARGSALGTPLDRSICRHVVAVGARRSGPGRYPSSTPRSRASGVGAYLGVPLVTADGHVLGAFCVFDAVPRIWSDDDLATLTDLAASVGTEIELRIDIARRARLERELSEAKGRFEAYMQNSPALAFAKDAQGRLTYMNWAFAGQLRAEIRIGSARTIFDLWPADIAEQLRSNDLQVWDRDGRSSSSRRPVDRRWSAGTAGCPSSFRTTRRTGKGCWAGWRSTSPTCCRTQEALRRSEAESRTLAMVVARIDGRRGDRRCRLPPPVGQRALRPPLRRGSRGGDRAGPDLPVARPRSRPRRGWLRSGAG